MVSKIPQDGYHEIFKNSPAAMLIVDTDAPVYTILDVNDAYLSSTNTTRETLVGYGVFGAFPGNPSDEESKNIERTIFSFDQAIKAKKAHTMSNYRYDIPIRGTSQFEERYWTTTNTPVLNQNGDVIYFIHSPLNVTELYKAREREQASIEALNNNRQQLYSTFMQAPVGIAIFKGPNFVTELINPSLCELYGRTVDEMIDKPVFEVLTHSKGHGFEELLNNVRTTGIPFKGEGLAVKLLRNNQVETAYVNFVYEPFRENDGTISGVIVVAIEVTDHINAKKQIEEAEERTRLAIDAVGLGTYDLDLVTGEMITSTQFASIFGFDEIVPRDQYVGRFHRDDMNIRAIAHNNAPRDGKLFYEARIVWPDNTVHWGRVEGKVYYNAEGKAIRILGTILDFTDQKTTKEALAESEQLLRNITSAAPACLWMSDSEGLITYINQTWIDWTGRPFEDHLGLGWFDSIVEEDRKKSGERFMLDVADRSLFEHEFRINHVDGTFHWCVGTGRPQFRADGSFSGYIGACVDITEQKNLQQQKDDFIGIASHELKTPVTSIKAYTQVLERMLQKGGQQKEAEMIKRMDSQLNRLTGLIGDLLDVTKINSGRLQFNDREFDFNSLIKEIIEDLQQTTQRHKLIENFLPTGKVFGDAERIGQVITNLVTNAIKYSPNSDKIVVHTFLKNDEVNLCVEDFGIGIPKDKLTKVFEQFYRVSGDKQHTFPGLGLGLYISSEIIKREGGRIWVNSEEGQGSNFCFSLPALK